MKPDTAGTAGYGANASALAQQYESIQFEEVHHQVLHLFPSQPCRVLDIGAGSGRDAAALARKGHTVIAVEPTAAFRDEGQRRHRLPNLAWLDDHLPALPATRQSQQRFDVILLTAVWMHLEADERQIGMQNLADLLRPGGNIFMTLRHGPVPEGRKMFDVSTQETIALGEKFGLQKKHVSERRDMFDRGDIRWSHVVLEKNEASAADHSLHASSAKRGRFGNDNE